MIILPILLLIVFSTCVYIILNLFRKLEILEKNYITLLEEINSTLVYMRIIDDKQMFENDDEVGMVFKELTHAVNKLSNFISTEEDT
jgi:hypothetical protein